MAMLTHQEVQQGDTVTTVSVETLMRGTIEVAEEQIITFVSPLLGFEDQQRFLIYQTKPGPLFWLQSCSNKDVSFAVLMPFAVGLDPDYDLSPAELDILGTSDVAAITVYTMVTLCDDPQQTTTNLRAPILVAGNKAVQLIYDNEALDLRFPLASLAKGNNA
ncbi:MAG: hypothetical protein EA402_00825 [Planctomycetota bacterium]|nr:MAG: hypothetical protein EA402_00825 [Planctomycetota bacterium]